MSCFCLFSNGNVDKVSTAEAIDLINVRMRNLSVKISSVEHKMRSCRLQARKHVENEDTERARMCLSQIAILKKKRTRYLGVNQKLWQMSETLNEQDTYVCISETFKTGVNTMESLLETVSIGDIEDMMDKFEEQKDDTSEVGHALRMDYTQVDDDEIEQEIEALMVGVIDDMPSVPKQEQIQKEPTHQKRILA